MGRRGNLTPTVLPALAGGAALLLAMLVPSAAATRADARVTNGRIMYVVAHPDRDHAELWTVDARTRSPRRFPHVFGVLGGHEWSPDGTRVARAQFGARCEIAILDRGGRRRYCAYGNCSCAAPGVSWSPQAWWLVVFAEGDQPWLTSVEVVDLTHGRHKPWQFPPEEQDPRFEPAWSPTGGVIAFAKTREGEKAAVDDIVAARYPGGERRTLTHGPGSNDSPSWSPGGQRIVFASTRDGDWDLYTMRFDGSDVRHLTNDRGSETDPDWSPDGKQIAFVSDRRGNDDIYVLDLASGRERRLTSSFRNEGAPDWRPVPAR